MRAFVHPLSGTPSSLRVLSWNLLRRVGARAEDVAALIRVHRPDLVLLQEATEDIAVLPQLVGGHFCRHGMDRRIYGLAAWSHEPFTPSVALRLPASVMPGRVPPRLAQLVKFRGIHFANVHLSHGQFLNRWQLLHIAEVLEGPAAIIGDFNAVGPIPLARLPRYRPAPAHPPGRQCRGAEAGPLHGRGRWRPHAAEVLDKGASDHHPIVLDLKAGEGAMTNRVMPGLLESLIARRARKNAQRQAAADRL